MVESNALSAYDLCGSSALERRVIAPCIYCRACSLVRDLLNALAISYLFCAFFCSNFMLNEISRSSCFQSIIKAFSIIKSGLFMAGR